VMISTNGGSSWQGPLIYWDEDHDAYGPGALVNIELTAYAGQSTVMISFHYVASSWDGWIQIDTLSIVDN